MSFGTEIGGREREREERNERVRKRKYYSCGLWRYCMGGNTKVRKAKEYTLKLTNGI